jgi:uncharacterized repeat protein (TIGR01451 family)
VPSLTPDGRFIAWMSTASNLVADDTNQCTSPLIEYPDLPERGGVSCPDVFVQDLVTGKTELISVSSSGEQGNDDSGTPDISFDGRFVAFVSEAKNLVPEDRNGAGDIFVHDRTTGITERVSLTSDGQESNGLSGQPVISGDGRVVAFFSDATNLVPNDTNDILDVFVHDRSTGITERVSVSTDGQEGDWFSLTPAISEDGRFVAFASAAANLVPDDTNAGVMDIFVRDRATGTTERVTEGGTPSALGFADASDPSISADGGLVAFTSERIFAPGDRNNTGDIFVQDRSTGVIERVSVASDGTDGNLHSPFSEISPDGRFVAFASQAANLVPEDTSINYDVFVRDRLLGITERVSISDERVEGDDISWDPVISDGGRLVAYTSGASNLVPGDDNNRWDLFLRQRGSALGITKLEVAPSEGSAAVSGWATFSGTMVATASDPGNDAGPQAREQGAEITGASLVYRVELEDILWHLSLDHIPMGSLASLGVVYGLELSAGGARYEVRAQPNAVSGTPPKITPIFALYRCETTCVELTRLGGGVGTTGNGVLVSIPISALGVTESDRLTLVRAFAGLGDAAVGVAEELDQVALPDAELPRSGVGLGVAPAGTPENAVQFGTPAALVDGAFTGTLDLSSLEPGEYEAWARACLGTACATGSTPLSIGSADLALTKTDSRDPAPTGRNLTYVLVVTNNGSDAASGVSLTDQLPPSMTFVSATSSQGTCIRLAGTVTCSLGTLASGTSVTVEIVVTPGSAGRITNTASVTASTPDPSALNNTDSEDTKICRITSRRSSIPCL